MIREVFLLCKDIEDRYRDGEDQRLEVLMKWVGRYGPQATYGKVYDVLDELEEGVCITGYPLVLWW